MDNTSNEVTGYIVKNDAYGFYVDYCPKAGNFTTDKEPTPVPRGDAFRRLAAFLDANPRENHEFYVVLPVYRVYTPMERASKELGGLLESLCQRHGLNLGLNSEQIEQRIASELASMGASGGIQGTIAALRGGR